MVGRAQTHVGPGLMTGPYVIKLWALPEAGFEEKNPNFRGNPVVEVPGIEPGSFGVLSGLLRAQLAMSLLGPTAHASELV